MGIRLKHTFRRGVLAGYLSIALTLPLLQFGGIASAATKKTTPAVGYNNSFRLTPLRTSITINPGGSDTVDIRITNLTPGTANLMPIENDFVAGNENGAPALILDNNAYAPTHSLKRFMVPLSPITIPPTQTATVTVTIKVPKNTQAGGYFGAVRFVPVGTSGQLAIGTNVASLILLTVPGPTVEQLTLTNFDVQQNGGTASNFRTPDDLALFLRFLNKGNLQEAPFGQIYVQKGNKVVYSYNFNQDDPKAEILPDSARRWTIPLKKLGKFGRYTVGATFTYGAKGQTIEITKTIWIIPSTYIFGGLAVIVIIAAIVVGLYLFMKSYKRKILRSSRRRY